MSNPLGLRLAVPDSDNPESVRRAIQALNFNSQQMASMQPLDTTDSPTFSGLTLTGNAVLVGVTLTGDVVLGTSTGTKIGTAANQKLGFWGKTPIVQPSAALSAQDMSLLFTAPGDFYPHIEDAFTSFSQVRLNEIHYSLMRGINAVKADIIAVKTALVNAGIMT